MPKFKVRDHFHVHLNGAVHGPGEVVELTEEQANRYAHQIEPVTAPQPAKAKARGNAE